MVKSQAALVYFPEKAGACCAPWAVPQEIRRLTSDEKATAVHAQQINALLSQETFPFHDRLSVVVVDSTLSAVTFLGPITPLRNLVTVARTRCNRVFYQKPVSTSAERKRGHPRWYESANARHPTIPHARPSVHADTDDGDRRGGETGL